MMNKIAVAALVAAVAVNIGTAVVLVQEPKAAMITLTFPDGEPQGMIDLNKVSAVLIQSNGFAVIDMVSGESYKVRQSHALQIMDMMTKEGRVTIHTLATH